MKTLFILLAIAISVNMLSMIGIGVILLLMKAVTVRPLIFIGVCLDVLMSMVGLFAILKALS